jgi:hypothetical protein
VRPLAAVAVAAFAGAVVLHVVLATPLGREPSGPAPASPRATLPFDLPPAEDLRASPRLVFAHYWPPLPISIDNKPPERDYYARNYLTPDGEAGKHAAYGGHLRDRPLPRPPSPHPDWRLRDRKKEVRQAAAAGLDGFALDVLQLEGDPDVRVWENARLLLRAAEEVDPGFRVMLMPDLSGSLVDKSPEQLAAAMATLAGSPAAFRLADGRLVVAPFKAEAHDPPWWQTFRSVMRAEHGLDVALVPVFVGDERELGPRFVEVSYGLSRWGARNPEWNDPADLTRDGTLARVSRMRELRPLWMQPVSVQDARPRQGIFDEAENTTNLRRTWQLARESGAQWVQVPTWNDYTESTHVAPSVDHGWTFLDLMSFYLTWFKTGEEPEVVRDAVYVTHRTQPWDAEPRVDQTLTMQPRGGSAPRDTVEALAFLTRPARVTVTVGGRSTTCRAPAGVSACTAPLRPGRVSAAVTRAGARVVSVTSPHEVTDEPTVQDLAYVGVGSLRRPG